MGINQRADSHQTPKGTIDMTSRNTNSKIRRNTALGVTAGVLGGGAIGLMLGGVDFSAVAITVREGTEEAAAVTLNWGAFTQTVVDFLIIAFAIFMVIRAMNTLKRKEEEAPAAPPEPSEEVQLLTEIRDSLRR